MITQELYKEEIKHLSCKDDMSLFIQKYFLHGTPYIFMNREIDYFNFRNKIAKHFHIEFYEVSIVGSCKFGFSPIRFTRIDESKRNEKSDVDVVIVSEKLYEKYFNLLCELQYKINSREIVLRNKPNENEIRFKIPTPDKKYIEFISYFIKGWIRPDLLPLSEEEFKNLKDEWFNFFKSLSFGNSEVGDRKVNAGLFKNYTYAVRYYRQSLEKLSKL